MPTVSAFLVQGTALSTVAGLYVTYPAVLVASAKFGVVGASGASLVVGVASTVSTLVWAGDGKRRFEFISYAISSSLSLVLTLHSAIDKPTTSKLLSPEDQFVWIHLFLVVLVATSLFFVIILDERDTARANIERYVQQ